MLTKKMHQCHFIFHDSDKYIVFIGENQLFFANLGYLYMYDTIISFLFPYFKKIRWFYPFAQASLFIF